MLLGASNLTRGFADVVELARERLGAPLEVLSALGHGRSYGIESSFLFRTLPGIERCGLWAQLAAGEPRPTEALITDVGNDVAFGVAPATLAAWLARCLDRLQEAGARPVLTGLPLFRLEALDPFWFGFWSRLFFPGRDLEHGRVLDRARAAQGFLEQEARARGLALVDPLPAWYGRDPIHYARARRRAAWATILASWEVRPAGGPWEASEPAGRVPLPPAAETRLFGVARSRNQPAGRMADGTTLSMY